MKYSNYRLGKRSVSRLVHVHPDLVMVIALAILISDIDFTVLEGKRLMKRQRKMVRQGKSWTLNSRHLAKVPRSKLIDDPVAHAVDLAPYINGKASFDWADYPPIEKAMKTAAKILNIPVIWGGDWKGKKKDGPHWELAWRLYPIQTAKAA